MSNFEVVLRSFGRFSTIGVLIILYLTGWIITVSWFNGNTSRDNIIEHIASVTWIIFHVVLLVSLMIWSWF